MSQASREGWTHNKQRQAWAPIVNTGTIRCPRCGQLIDPTVTPWDLGHPDDRPGGKHPEHAHCNRRAGAIKGNAKRNWRPYPPPRKAW